MNRSFFARSVTALVLLATTSTSIAFGDPPPPPPLAVWRCDKRNGRSRAERATENTQGRVAGRNDGQVLHTGKCRLTGTVRTPAGNVAIPGRDFMLTSARGTSTHVDRRWLPEHSYLHERLNISMNYRIACFALFVAMLVAQYHLSRRRAVPLEIVNTTSYAVEWRSCGAI